MIEINRFSLNRLESTNNILIQEKRLHVAESLQTVGAPFCSNATFLVPTERCTGREIKMRINPSISSLELPRNSAGLLEVVDPDRCTKAHLGIICSGNNIRFIGPRQKRYDGPCKPIRYHCWKV